MINLAWPGAGNKYISDSVIHQCTVNKYDAVLVMWSGLTRLDIPVPTSLRLFDDYDFKRPVGPFNYIMSGGVVGSWQHHPDAIRLFEDTYKFLSTTELVWLSLLEIIKLQGFLKNLGIKYYFMSYINYWNQPQSWLSRNCDPPLGDFIKLKDIVNQIDFSQWIFLNDNRDGIYEIAQQSNLFEEDNWHPNSVADRHWAKIVSQRIN
jgi:hypothetical protein